MKKILIFCLFLTTLLSASSKPSNSVLISYSADRINVFNSFVGRYMPPPLVTDQKNIVQQDSLSSLYVKDILSMPIMTDSLAATIDYNPKYYRLFVTPTYYYAPMESISTLNWKMPDLVEKNSIDTISPLDSIFNINDYKLANIQVNKTLLNLYLKNYQAIQTTESQVMSRELFHSNISAAPVQKTKFANLFKQETKEENLGKASLMSYKPNWWTYGGNISLQMTQNYVSGNWYKGGESTNTALGYLALKANYNDNEKVQWDNLLEAKYGITSSPSDTCHKYLVSNDLLRIYSKLGVQASKRWYYTISGEFNTQFSNSYKKNTNDVLAAFMSPANLILSIGMDYKIKTKKLDFSLLLSPLAYNWRYVGDDRVNQTTYGLKDGRKSLNLFGSKLTSTWTWQIIPTVAWTSRLYYFTDYTTSQAEWENTFNFLLNKYLSAQLFVHGRYDDSATPVEGSSYFQIKEYLSFGINYAW